jgi:hypothetical protein
MLPLLLINAVSAAGDIYHTMATQAAENKAAKEAAAASATGATGSATASFPAMMQRTALATMPAKPTAEQVAATQKDLTSQLYQSNDVVSAINASGAKGPFQIKLEANGSASLHAADGTVKPLTLSPETKAIAEKLYLVQSSINTAAAAQTTTPATTLTAKTTPTTAQINRGVGITSAKSVLISQS